MTFKEFPEESFVATESTEDDVQQEIDRIRAELKEAEKSGAEEETLVGYEDRIRQLEAERTSLSKRSVSERESDTFAIQESVEPEAHAGLDYDGKIAVLREGIRKAEKDNDEKQVLALEDELRSLEQDKLKALEQLDYEAARSVVVAGFEEIQKEIKDRTSLVKDVENTDEQRYTEQLALLREKEQERTEVGTFLSRYWGKTLEDYQQAKQALGEDIATASDLNDLGKRLESWGGIPDEANGTFSTYSEFFKQIQDAFATPPGSERVRRLQALEVSPVVKDRILELYAKEEVGLSEEYNRVLEEEVDLRKINNVVHSGVFQSAVRFLPWSLIPKNREVLNLFKKYGIAYDSPEARRSAAPIGSALKLNAALHKKKELEGVIPKKEEAVGVALHETVSSEVLPEDDTPENLLGVTAAEISQDSSGDEVLDSEESISSSPEISNTLTQKSEWSEDNLPEEYSGDYEEHTVTPEEIERVAHVRVREEHESIENVGREIKRLKQEEKKLQNLQTVVSSDIFPFNLRLPWVGTKWRKQLEAYHIPYATKQEKKTALSRVSQRLQEVKKLLVEALEDQKTGRRI